MMNRNGNIRFTYQMRTLSSLLPDETRLMTIKVCEQNRLSLPLSETSARVD